LNAFLYGQDNALLFAGNALLPRDRFEASSRGDILTATL
jgi:hypothetical protein